MNVNLRHTRNEMCGSALVREVVSSCPQSLFFFILKHLCQILHFMESGMEKILITYYLLGRNIGCHVNWNKHMNPWQNTAVMYGSRNWTFSPGQEKKEHTKRPKKRQTKEPTTLRFHFSNEEWLHCLVATVSMNKQYMCLCKSTKRTQRWWLKVYFCSWVQNAQDLIALVFSNIRALNAGEVSMPRPALPYRDINWQNYLIFPAS